MIFAKAKKNEDGVVSSPPNKGLMQTLVCSPSLLKKTMRKVSSPLQNDSDPLVQQKRIYEIEDSHLCSRKDGGRIQRCLEPTMSDPIATQNYGATNNVLAAKDISRATKSTIPRASHSQGTVPRLWSTKKKHHLKTQLVHCEPLIPKCSDLCQTCSGISHVCKLLSTLNLPLHQNRSTHHNFDEWFQSQCCSMGSSLGYPHCK